MGGGQMTKAYTSSLTYDHQFDLIAPLIPAAKPGGRHREVDIFLIVSAPFYTWWFKAEILNEEVLDLTCHKIRMPIFTNQHFKRINFIIEVFT